MPTRARRSAVLSTLALLVAIGPTMARGGAPWVTERLALAERGAAPGGVGATRTLPPIRWTSLTSGRVVLHTLGLRVALPSQPGLAWRTGGYVARDGQGRLMAVARLRQVTLVGGSTLRSYFVQAGQLDATCDASVKDRNYPTTAGHDGHLTIAKQRWRYRLGTQAGTGRVVLLSACADIGPRRLLVRMLAEGDGTPAWVLAQLDGAKPLMQALAAEMTARSWSTAASPAAAGSVARDRSIPKRVLRLRSLRVPLPEDGLIWGASRRTTKGTGKVPDQLVLRAPAAPATTLSVEVAATPLRCSDVLHTRGKARRGSAKPAGLPLGYEAGVEVLGADGFFNTLLCYRHAGRLMVLQLGELDRPVTDARAYAGILQALKDAFAPAIRGDDGVAVNQKKAPTSSPKPKAPPAPSPPAPNDGKLKEKDDLLDVRPGVKTMAESTSTRDRLRSVLYLGTEVIVSHRDAGAAKLNEDRYPATRVAYLGLDAGALLARVGSGFGYAARLSFGATPDWGAIDGAPSADGSFGGMRAEVNADLYVGAGIADRLFIGLGGGYHAMDGPLTKNGSLALSALVGWLPEDPSAFSGWLRVTPVQLFGSNQRWVAAPLAIELRGVFGNRLAVGLEFQYTGPASPDDLVPAEGFATMLRVGVGLSATP